MSIFSFNGPGNHSSSVQIFRKGMTSFPLDFGNCKFGAKCALAHILPDGRRVNRPSPGLPAGNLNLGGRVNPEPYRNHPSALANSLLQAQVTPAPFGTQYPLPPQEDFLALPALQMNHLDTLPAIDTGFVSSRPDSTYGSPRDDNTRFPISPAIKGLSALDAPLPASFDSNGISWIARNGPVAASVPSKFGLESPPHSFKEIPPSDALRTLHDSAFGGNGDRSQLSNLATSPPPSAGESAGPRMMHSQKYAKTKVMSTSLPRAGLNDDWDSTFAFEEDFIPNALHDLLTPQEKMRRFSRTGGVDEDGINTRPSLSGFGSPGEPSSKVGSPTASSPSRFGPLFSRQKREDDHTNLVSGFGHVGSPLRNSLLIPGSSPGLRPISRPTPGDISPYFASPPRQSSMSMISQQLQRTRLSKADSFTSSEGGGLQPTTSVKPSSLGSAGKLDRVLSSSSVGNGRTVCSIDEEPGEVFSMEEEDDVKRYGEGWNDSSTTGVRSPPHYLGSVGNGRGTTTTTTTTTTTGSERKEEGKDYGDSLFRAQ
ncbi:MAG: hypothetical protein M1816_003818 [Peltula sp. TS41687]|nr:MAG: hypothetical protein M1816_003818 [Peltula sp. TS41687]